MLAAEGPLTTFELGESGTYDDLARLFGLDPDDPDIEAQIYRLLLERVLRENPEAVIESLIELDGRGDVAVDVVRDFLLQNTSYLDEAIAAGGDSLQQYLDLVEDGATQAEMDHLFGEVLKRLIDLGDYEPDSSLDEVTLDMKQFADNLAGIMYQFNRAGERNSYDITGVLEFLARQGAGFVPFGDQALLVIDGADALLDGYQESTLYLDLKNQEDIVTDQSIASITAIIAAGGPNSEAFATLVNDEGGVVEAYAAIRNDISNPLHKYLDEFRQEISDRVDQLEGQES